MRQLESLQLWEKEADNRERAEKVCKSVKVFVSLCLEDTHDKMVQMTPRALVEEVTGSSYYTMPFCDHASEFDPKWPQDGSFEKSHNIVTGIYKSS